MWAKRPMIIAVCLVSSYDVNFCTLESDEAGWVKLSIQECKLRWQRYLTLRQFLTMKEMSNVKTNATTESAGQFYIENRLSNRKNLNFISSYLRGIFWAIGAIVHRLRRQEMAAAGAYHRVLPWNGQIMHHHAHFTSHWIKSDFKRHLA